MSRAIFVSRISYLVSRKDNRNQESEKIRIGYWVKKEKKHHSSFYLTIPVEFTLTKESIEYIVSGIA